MTFTCIYLISGAVKNISKFQTKNTASMDPLQVIVLEFLSKLRHAAGAFGPLWRPQWAPRLTDHDC